MTRLDTACIEWAGCKKEGYGRFVRNGKQVYAHRVAYVESRGVSLESIAGLLVRHKCDNPGCVNPEHLELGTAQDNVNDKMERGRCHRQPGELNPSARLTQAQIREIRARYVRGSKTDGQVQMAREYGVTQAQISQIILGKKWKAA